MNIRFIYVSSLAAVTLVYIVYLKPIQAFCKSFGTQQIILLF